MIRGEVHPSEGGKTITAAFGVWAGKKGRWIYILMAGDGTNFTQVAITNNPKSTMYHKTLFRDLRRLLNAYGKWPFGEEGAETEESRVV